MARFSGLMVLPIAALIFFGNTCYAASTGIAEVSTPPSGGAPTDVLFRAAKERNHDELKSLLSKGTNPDSVDGFGQTALVFSILAGDAEGVHILLAAGANPNTTDAHGMPLISLATSEGYLDIVEDFIAAKADVNKKDHDGATPIMEAADKGHAAIVRKLLAAGADPNSAANDGTTALWAASNSDLDECMEILIPLSKNVNVRDNQSQRTILMNVANWGRKEPVKALLARGADVNAVDERGWTALMWATKEDHPDIASMLIAGKANLKIKNKAGETALGIAKREGHPEIAAILKKAGLK